MKIKFFVPSFIAICVVNSIESNKNFKFQRSRDALKGFYDDDFKYYERINKFNNVLKVQNNDGGKYVVILVRNNENHDILDDKYKNVDLDPLHNSLVNYIISKNNDDLDRNHDNLGKHKDIDELEENDHDDKPILRENIVNKMKVKNILEAKHEKRLLDIVAFMGKDGYGTKYLHDEVQRIKNTHEIRDQLRRIIWYLEQSGKDSEIETMKKYFYSNKNDIRRPYKVWDQKTNNLVVNVLKDPFNDGVN